MKKIARIRLTDKPPAFASTELERDFNEVHAVFEADVGPRDSIERMLTEDIAYLAAEIRFYRRTKGALRKLAHRSALFELLTKDLGAPSTETTADLVERYYSEERAQAEVLAILGKYNLDRSAIEAAAFRLCAADLAVLEQMLASLELRRDRALHGIANYREAFVRRLTESSALLIGKEEPQPVTRLPKE
jgi:hypothetical protein